MRQFGHLQRLRVDDVAGDPAALGAAVTVELCGHWEHDGPCTWPHHTSTEPVPGGGALVTVHFDADGPDEAAVRARIVDALHARSLAGPDQVTRWGAVTAVE